MKNLYSFLILVVIGTLPFSQLRACSCGEFPPFCESAVYGELFLGRVLAHPVAKSSVTIPAYFTNIEVLDPMGTVGLPDTISMINQDGFNCNGDITMLSVGDRVIISIASPDIFQDDDYDVADYENLPPYRKYNLNGCGTYFLQVFNESVGGTISSQETVALSEFMANPIGNCPEIMVSTDTPLAEDVSVFPNPVKEQLQVNNNSSEELAGELHSVDGVLLRRFSIPSGQQQEIPLQDLPVGTYLLRLNDGKRAYSELIVR